MEVRTALRPKFLVRLRERFAEARADRRGTIGLGSFLLIFAQLALVLIVIRQFRVEESSGLVRIIPLILAGFAVHAWLPIRLRPAFFLLLSFLALGVTFGYPHGVMLLGIGLGLVLICHLPIPFVARVALLLLAAGVLIAVRLEAIPLRWTAVPTLVVPVIGAMFMFRLIIYMYDLRHEKKGATVSERLSYFFMFPNLYFLLFPVIDYQTYRRTYYDRDAFEVYQKGLHWMFRGVVQLLFYRIIYMHVLPAAADVTDLGGVVQYMVATYLLYLRISGQFHLIIGLMCLFGYNLPETHHLYYLASSFNDYWRRINIYWKDFMMKIFYYPSFMRLRRFGTMTALVLSTLIVFAGTWLLHSYQWLWLRGTFPITATDGLFWGILGVLVVGNSVFEARRGRKRTLGKPTWSLEGSLKHALKVVGMFVFLTTLWALWSSPSVRDFLSLLEIAAASSLTSWLLLLGGLVGLVAVGVLYQYLNMLRSKAAPTVATASPRWSTFAVGASALVVLVVGTPQLQEQLGPQAATAVLSVQRDQLNAQDRERQERGYYEGLLNEERFTSALWQMWRPKDWNGEDAYTRSTRDMYRKVLIPNADVVDRGARLTTNRWAMRDRDYALEKPPETYRIAVLGASHVMGLGVRDGEPFEAVLEERLNRENGGSIRFESLNFAVTAYGLLQNVHVVDQRIGPFEPDAVFYVTHNGELERTPEKLRAWAREGQELPHAFLRDVVEKSGVKPGMSGDEAQRRFRPFEESLVGWGYGRIARVTRDRGAVPVWVYLPLLGKEETSRAGEKEFLFRVAREAGFVTIDLGGVYDGHPVQDLIVAPWDHHPNALGHRLVAERLYQEMLAREAELGLRLGNVVGEATTSIQ